MPAARRDCSGVGNRGVTRTPANQSVSVSAAAVGDAAACVGVDAVQQLRDDPPAVELRPRPDGGAVDEDDRSGVAVAVEQLRAESAEDTSHAPSTP